MLAGQPPFLGSTAQEVLARHNRDPVPPLRTTRRELPEAVERAILRALAKAPADRFATPTDLSAALSAPDTRPVPWRRAAFLVLGTLATVALLAVGYAAVRRATSTRPAGTGADSLRSIAVLAFQNVGADSSNEAFSDGVAEELTTALGRVEGLSVSARTSAFSFKGKGLTAPEIGRQLRVRYVVGGSVQRADQRRRVHVQLTEVGTGRELWSGRFEHDVFGGNVFVVQDSIAHSIIRELRLKLPGAPGAAAARRPTENPEAYSLYQQGRYFFEKRDSASLRKAQEFRAGHCPRYRVRQGIRRSERCLQPQFGVRLRRARSGVSRAKAAAARALTLDSASVEAHTSQAFIALFYDWNWEEAGRHFDRALALDPRYSPAHLFRAWYFVALDRPEDAVAEARRAVDLDPFSLVANGRLASMLTYARRYEEAQRQSRHVLELDSLNFNGAVEAGRAYVFQDRCDEATRAVQGSHTPIMVSINVGLSGYIAARCGRRAAAQAELQRLASDQRAGHYVSHYGFAMIHAGLGNREQALAELERAIADRSWGMFTLKLDPVFETYRTDPRFIALLARLHLGS